MKSEKINVSDMKAFIPLSLLDNHLVMPFLKVLDGSPSPGW